MKTARRVEDRHLVIVKQACELTELDEVRSLLRAFVAWLRKRYVEDIALIDRYFGDDAFEQELAELPGKYAPPAGSLLIAYALGKPAGCVALTDLGPGICEMKRLFVDTQFRGMGVGRALVDQAIVGAKASNYHLIRLLTGKGQHEAVRLYERFGFTRVAPYYEITDQQLKDWLIFFELKL
jgi:ribosomal protein S18 acetylase RimI-like enzyme